jgi:hypothetical protein
VELRRVLQQRCSARSRGRLLEPPLRQNARVWCQVTLASFNTGPRIAAYGRLAPEQEGKRCDRYDFSS